MPAHSNSALIVAHLPLRPAIIPAVDVGHGLDHFAHCAVCEGAVDEGGHDVGIRPAGLADGVQGLGDARVVSACFELGEAVDLDGLDGVWDGEDVDRAVFVVVGVFVEADDDAVVGFALFGVSVGGLGDVAAEVAAVDAFDDSASVEGGGLGRVGRRRVWR